MSQESFELALDEVGKRRSTSAEVGDKGLVCYGCAHSIGSAAFPSGPSGERPCAFCVRNPDRERWQARMLAEQGRELKAWYDGTPIAFYPMDAYQTIDMQEQVERWLRKAQGDPEWNESRGGLRFG